MSTMVIRNKPKTAPGLAALGLLAALAAGPVLAEEGGSRDLFIASAVENHDNTVTLPLHRGLTADGREVWYVEFDTSEGKDAAARGINQASKLTNARNTAAVMRVQVRNGQIVFPATVDFSPERVVVPGPGGFPPAQALPGSVGEPGYSPLIQLPDGTIRNAPHVANRSGLHDKVIGNPDFARGRVTLQETDGFAGGKAVKYVSTDSSDVAAAALEGSTWAPALNAAPFAGGDGTDSARASLAVFVNGQTGASNPNRQGLASALSDGLDPLNVLAWTPNQGRYSPLWDIFPAAWSSAALAAGTNTRQTDFGKVRNLAQKGFVTAPDGRPWGAGGFIVNCPIVSSD
jgi:hypothetical protein